ncbi:MAG TPA: hypothetical protein VKT82_28130 [Ktedonobacterales bacterium]|nr:hypothetical protein [Ktedonobacterales bacterium]
MTTLKAALEEVAGLGPGYLISDHGAYWLADDMLMLLERDAPERLSYSASLVVPDINGDGAIYATEEAYIAASAIPLYRVHRLTHTPSPYEFPETQEQQL